MECKIERITHSGTMGERGTERADGRYPLRIGRIVNLDIKNIKIGHPIIAEYIKDSDSSDFTWKYLLTSPVIKTIETTGTISIETMDSIFEFRKIWA